MNLTVILGTARVHRQSQFVADLVKQKAQDAEKWNIEYIDVKDWMNVERTIPNWEKESLDQTEKWRAVVKNTDAFLCIVPEYNHGYPGEFKLLIDQASTDDYLHKPVAVCGVSRGDLGGARVLEHLLQLWGGIGAVFAGSVRFPQVEEIFDESGNIQDEKYLPRIEKMLTQLLAYAEAMENVRNTLKK